MNKGDIIDFVRKNGGDDAPIILGLIQVESSFNERAFLMDHNGGSYGLMQLNVAAARQVGFEGKPADLFEGEVNLPLGIKYFAWIRNFLENHEIFDLDSAIAAYNEGVGNVLKRNPDPLYVERVMTAMKEFT